VAVNELKKKIVFVEVKRNKTNISLSKLEAKTGNLRQMFKGFTFDYKGLSLEDM